MEKKFVFRNDTPIEVSGWALLWKKLNPIDKSDHFPNIFDIVLRSLEITSRQLQTNSLKEQKADICIHPPVGQFGLLDYKSFEQIVRAGYEYALENVDQWKKQLSLDSRETPE